MLEGMKNWVRRESGIIMPASSESHKDDGGVNMSRRNFGKMLLGAVGASLLPKAADAYDAKTNKELDDLIRGINTPSDRSEERPVRNKEAVTEFEKDLAEFLDISRKNDGSLVVSFNTQSQSFQEKYTQGDRNLPKLYSPEFAQAFVNYCLKNIPAERSVTSLNFSGFSKAPSEQVADCLQVMDSAMQRAQRAGGVNAEKVKNMRASLLAEIARSFTIRAAWANKRGETQLRDAAFGQSVPYINELLRGRTSQLYVSDYLQSTAQINMLADYLFRGDVNSAMQIISSATNLSANFIKKEYAEKQPEKWRYLVNSSREDAHLLKMTPEAMIRQSSEYLALKHIADTLAGSFHLTSEVASIYSFVATNEQELAKYTFKAPTAFLTPEQLAACKAKAVCYAAKKNFAILRVEKNGTQITRAGGKFFSLTEPDTDFVMYDVRKGVGKGLNESSEYASIDPFVNNMLKDYLPYSGKDAPLYALRDVQGLDQELKSGAFYLEQNFIKGAQPIFA